MGVSVGPARVLTYLDRAFSLVLDDLAAVVGCPGAGVHEARLPGLAGVRGLVVVAVSASIGGHARGADRVGVAADDAQFAGQQCRDDAFSFAGRCGCPIWQPCQDAAVVGPVDG
jgi:hypothetical protein